MYFMAHIPVSSFQLVVTFGNSFGIY